MFFHYFGLQRNEMDGFLASFARGPGVALLFSGCAVAVLLCYFKYSTRNVRSTPRVLGPDPNKTVALPLVKITQVSHDTKIFRLAQVSCRAFDHFRRSYFCEYFHGHSEDICFRSNCIMMKCFERGTHHLERLE